MIRNDPTHRYALLALGDDLGWPRAFVGTAAFEGKAAWWDGLQFAMRCDRRQWLLSLADALLTASAGGTARLRAWRETKAARPPIPEREHLDWLCERVHLFGDIAPLRMIAYALLRAPEPVREMLIEEVAFVTVGGDSAAWCGSGRFCDRNGRRLDSVVVLGPSTDLRTVLHELAHCWHAVADAERPPMMCAQGESGLMQLATDQGWRPQADAFVEQSERLADATAFAWADEVFE